MTASAGELDTNWEGDEAAEIECLLRRARAGDAEAKRALCVQFYDCVQTRVHASLERDVRRGRPWLASLFSTNDIVQDVLMGVLRDLDSFRGRTRLEFVAYLSRLTRNRILDALRYHEAARRDGRRTDRGHSPDQAVESDPPEDRLIRAEDVERAYSILKSFSERDRALLRARSEDGEAYETLANELGYASADAARKAYHSVRSRLILKMRRSGG